MWINFLPDYILQFWRILAFSAKYNPRDIYHHREIYDPSVKFSLGEISREIFEK